MKIIFSFIVLSFISSSIGCMNSPHDGENVEDRHESVSFSGYLELPNGLVRIEILDSDGQWHKIGETNSSSSEFPKDLYAWSKSIKLPRVARFWPGGNATIRSRYNSGNLYTGTESVWSCVYDEFLGGKSHRDAYEFCDNTNLQSRDVSVIGSCDLLVNGDCFDNIDSSKKPDWPSNTKHDFSEKLQGITNDGTNWYMTSIANNGTVAKYNKDADLSKSPSSSYEENVFNPGWKHLGDLDYFNGGLYIAMERNAGGDQGTASGNAVGYIPTNSISNHSTHVALPLTNSSPQLLPSNFPWIARDPVTGFFFSSEFNTVDTLHRYKLIYDSFGNPSEMKYCGDVQIEGLPALGIERVQGGDFSASGKLYLASDVRILGGQDIKDTPIVHVIEMNGHMLSESDINCDIVGTDSTHPYNDLKVQRLKVFNHIKNHGYFQLFGSFIWYEEVEGITVWDLPPSETYQGKDIGDIHTILLNKENLTDGFWIKHRALTPGSTL